MWAGTNRIGFDSLDSFSSSWLEFHSTSPQASHFWNGDGRGASVYNWASRRQKLITLYGIICLFIPHGISIITMWMLRCVCQSTDNTVQDMIQWLAKCVTNVQQQNTMIHVQLLNNFSRRNLQLLVAYVTSVLQRKWRCLTKLQPKACWALQVVRRFPVHKSPAQTSDYTHIN